MSYTYITVISMALVVVATAILDLFKKGEYAWIPSIIFLLPNLYVNINYIVYPILVDIAAINNIIALKVLKQSPYRGFEYALISVIGLATSYVLYVPISTTEVGLASYYGSLLALFMIVSAASYFIIQLGFKPENIAAAVKAIVALVIATVLFFTGSSILLIGYFSSITGTSNIGYVSTLAIVGYTMALLGLMLEVGAAPMHVWVPDVFTAGEYISVSILASIVKIMPMLVFIKLIRPMLAQVDPSTADYIYWLTAAMSTVSMFVGNIGALTSREYARVLAYSSIANMGYVLAAVAVMLYPGSSTYALAYALAGLIMQLLVNAVGKVGFFTAVKGEGRGYVFSYFLGLSFIGTPPLLGFWSKLFIILSLIYIGPIGIWLAVVLVVNSVISIPYYVRLSSGLGSGKPTGAYLASIAFAAIVMAIGVVVPVPSAIATLSRSLLSYVP